MNMQILNQPKERMRDIRIERNGRITLRARPCSALELTQGCKIVFCMLGGQMYLFSDNNHEAGLAVSGRNKQLHVCSVATAKALLAQVRNAPKDAPYVELIASPHVREIRVGNKPHQAIAIINVL